MTPEMFTSEDYRDTNAITLDERFRWICQARNDLLYACKKAEANIRLRGDSVKMTSTLEVLQRAIAKHDVPDWDKIIAESVARQRVQPYEGSAEHEADLKDAQQ